MARESLNGCDYNDTILTQYLLQSGDEINESTPGDGAAAEAIYIW